MSVTPESGLEATLDALKRRARSTWALGDYDAVAEGIWSAGDVVVRAVGVHSGDRVLDVACGTGNAATRAALAGGRVIGLDLTPELFVAARRRAAEAGVELTLVEGDAEDLPFGDASFDVVLSTFGVMFAPRHAVASAELARVLRPGGRIGLACWTPEGTVGKFFSTMARHVPPPPPIAEPPLLWGTEAHLRDIFAGTGVDLEVERTRIPLAPDVEPSEAIDFYLTNFGPLVAARQALEPEGRWAALEADMRPQIALMVADPPEYLVITGTKRG